MSRIALGEQFLAQHRAMLRCPLCHTTMQIAPGGVVCARGHRVDISRKGVLSLCRAVGDARYDRTLFAARRRLMQAGFFAPLYEAMLPLLPQSECTLADAGCGEGAWLCYLQQHRTHADTYVGLDLSAAAVEAAGRYTTAQCMLLRADVANLPLQTGSMDVVCNLLTPAAYREFARVLRPGGHILKVMPTPQHLQEVRAVLQMPFPREDETRRLFLQHCSDGQCREITYTLPVEEALQEDLWVMTPLSHGRAALRCPEVTFSFWLCSGTPDVNKEDG